MQQVVGFHRTQQALETWAVRSQEEELFPEAIGKVVVLIVLL